MEEKVEKEKSDVAIQVNSGLEPVALGNEQINNTSVAPIAPDTSNVQEQELSTLRE